MFLKRPPKKYKKIWRYEYEWKTRTSLIIIFFFFSPFFLYLVVWFFPLLNISPPDCISPTIYIYIYIAHYYVAFSLGFFCSFFFKRWFKKLNPDRSFLFYHSDMSLGYWMDKIYIFFYFYLPPYPNTRNDDVSSTGRKGMSSQTKVQNREIALLLLRPFITFGSSWLWFSSIISSVVLHYIMRCCTVFSCIVDFFILWSWNLVVLSFVSPFPDSPRTVLPQEKKGSLCYLFWLD